jgi:hypothetical protein
MVATRTGSATLRRCIRVENTGDLCGSNDGAFISSLCRGGRHEWDRRRHPDLQAHRVDAFGSYALPPWALSCCRGGAEETLAQGMDRDSGDSGLWRGQGNPNVGWCVGCLYSGPASGGVRSDWLVPFGAARLGPVCSFGFVLSVHICSA